MLYTLKLNDEEIQNILKALACAEDNDVLDYETVARLYDYITDERQGLFVSFRFVLTRFLLYHQIS
ncbi:MAG: hypothetical protein FWC41_04840 [Firmicutes bacterium]|nr:hypothetical protein [Bacillota bacterium]